MRGRPLKDQPQDGGKRRQFEFTELGRDPVANDEKIGRRPGGGRWLGSTRRWWETWRTSPQSSQFTGTDWEALRRLAVLVDEFYRSPSSSLAGEIRQMEGKFGATIDDRMRLRLRIHSRGADAPAVESPAASSEPRLRRVAGDPRLKLVDEGGK